MTTEEKLIGRIRAILGASEEVISSARKYNDINVVGIAKETAYDRIKGIIEDPEYNPWQE